MESMYCIGLDVHKKTISCCVKDASGRIHAEGKIPATLFGLDQWMKTLPQQCMVAMEAAIFTGWIYGMRPQVIVSREGGASADAAGHCRG